MNILKMISGKFFVSSKKVLIEILLFIDFWNNNVKIIESVAIAQKIEEKNIMIIKEFASARQWTVDEITL